MAGGQLLDALLWLHRHPNDAATASTDVQYSMGAQPAAAAAAAVSLCAAAPAPRTAGISRAAVHEQPIHAVLCCSAGVLLACRTQLEHGMWGWWLLRKLIPSFIRTRIG